MPDPFTEGTRVDARAEDLMWQAAGMGAGAVMQQAPDVVMPTEVIEKGMQSILAEYRNLAPAPSVRQEGTRAEAEEPMGGRMNPRQVAAELRDAAEERERDKPAPPTLKGEDE